MMQEVVESALLDVDAVAKLLGVSARHVWKMNRNGRLGPTPVHLGRRALWRRDELLAWVDVGCPSRAKWRDLGADKKR